MSATGTSGFPAIRSQRALTSALRKVRYGADHYRLRRSLAPFVAAGGVACVRCSEPIEPGEPWDLGHMDGDPSRYAGPEHARCNRRVRTHRKERSVSRRW